MQFLNFYLTLTQLWTNPKLSIFELLQHMGDEKIFSGPKLFIFVKKFWLCLFPTNINKPFRLKNSQKLPFFSQNREKQTKSKTFLENGQTWCWNITYFSNPDIRPKGKKLDHFKVKCQKEGVGAPGSDPSKRHNLSVWNHI